VLRDPRSTSSRTSHRIVSSGWSAGTSSSRPGARPMVERWLNWVIRLPSGRLQAMSRRRSCGRPPHSSPTNSHVHSGAKASEALQSPRSCRSWYPPTKFTPAWPCSRPGTFARNPCSATWALRPHLPKGLRRCRLNRTSGSCTSRCRIAKEHAESAVPPPALHAARPSRPIGFRENAPCRQEPFNCIASCAPPPSACIAHSSIRCHGQVAPTAWVHRQGEPHGRARRGILPDVVHELRHGPVHAFGGEYLELVRANCCGTRTRSTTPTFRRDDDDGPADQGVVWYRAPCRAGRHPRGHPTEACYLGWQESLALLAMLVEAEIPD